MTAGDNLSASCDVTVKHVYDLRKVQEGAAPTCTEDGKLTFYWCDKEHGCGKTFFDAEATKEFSLQDIDTHELIIPAYDHVWTQWEIDRQPTRKTVGTIKRHCEICKKEQTNDTILANTTAIEEALSRVDHAMDDVNRSKDGSDIDPEKLWASEAAFDALETAIKEAQGVIEDEDQDYTQQQLNEVAERLKAAILTFSGSVKKGTKGLKPSGAKSDAKDIEKAILNATSNEGPAGTQYAPLKLRSTKQTKKSITLKWDKTAKASRYVIYGNLDGKKNKMKKLAAVNGSAKGVVTAKARGTCYVYAYAQNGVFKTIKVTVK